MVRSLALLILLVATFASYDMAKAGVSYEGQVVNVVPDEEGTNVMMKVKSGEFKSIYIPRSNANTEATQKAIEALRTKRNLKLSL